VILNLELNILEFFVRTTVFFMFLNCTVYAASTPLPLTPMQNQALMPDPLESEAVQSPSPIEPAVEQNPTVMEDPIVKTIEPQVSLPSVEYDLTKLPSAVQDMHANLIAAAKSGKIENLRLLLSIGEVQTQFSLDKPDDSQQVQDPLAFLLSLSGDPAGHEILAILLEILDAGYVHVDVGSPQEMYVWPYFFALPIDKLNDVQRVELFKIITSGDAEDMENSGGYIFYRAGISPDGKWRFFLAGD
jgi:hypothetical protein